MSCLSAAGQNGPNSKTKRVETCKDFYWGLILKGRLVNTLEFSQCEAVSGMTCRITLKGGAQLSSRISHVRVSMLWQSPHKLAGAKASVNQASLMGLNPLYTNMVLEDNDAIWRLVTVVAGDT